MSTDEMYQATPLVAIDQVAVALLESAEYFRSQTPPKYKTAIKCLKASFKTQMSHEMTAFINYQIGKLYFHYTKNLDLAKLHLEQAYYGMNDFGAQFTKYRIEVACLISEVYIQLKSYEPVKQLLRKESQFSRDYPLLHARLLFLLAEIHGMLGDWHGAKDIVDAGALMFGQCGDVTSECFFRLSSSMIVSMDLNRRDELISGIRDVSSRLETIKADDPSIDYLKAFCCSIQVCFFVTVGMLKSTKVCLRQLQLLVQSMKTSNEHTTDLLPSFVWMGKETLTALTYVLTVIQSIQNCQLERAHKYHSIAMRHISDLRCMMARNSWSLIGRGTLEALASFEIILLENIAATQLMLARPLDTISVLGVMLEKMRQNSEVFNHFEAQLHTLLGMYCWFVNLPEDAERQFQAALRTAKDTESWVVVNLSLAIVYLLTCKESDFYGLFERITPGKLQSSSPLLKASAHFIHALHSYLHSRLQEAKSHLTDSVTIVRDEGVPRIQALATLLSAKLVANEAPDMLVAANSWAVKSSDHLLTLWSNYLIYTMQLHFGQAEQAQAVKAKFDLMQRNIAQNIQEALNSQMHFLVKWEGGAETL